MLKARQLLKKEKVEASAVVQKQVLERFKRSPVLPNEATRPSPANVPELMELFLTGGLGTAGENFKQKFNKLLNRTPRIHSNDAQHPEFWTSFFLGSVLTLPYTKLMDELKIKDICVKTTDEKGNINEKTIKLVFRVEKDRRMQVILKTIATTEKIQHAQHLAYGEVEDIIRALRLTEADIKSCKITGEIVHIVDGQLIPDEKEKEGKVLDLKVAKNRSPKSLEELRAVFEELVKNKPQEGIDSKFEKIGGKTNIEENFEVDFIKLSREEEEALTVKEGAKKIFENLAETYRSTRLLLSNTEAAHHGYSYGALSMNFKYRYALDVNVERVAGKGFSDMMILSRLDMDKNKNWEALPIVVEFKRSNKPLHAAKDAIAQIKGAGYLKNPVSMRTVATKGIMVGVNFDSVPEERVEAEVSALTNKYKSLGEILKGDGIIKAIGGEQSARSAIKEALEKKLNHLYYSFTNANGGGKNTKYSSRVIMGELLADTEFKKKYIFICEDQLVEVDEISMFVLVTKSDEVVILNIIEEGSFSNEKSIALDELKIDLNKRLQIDIQIRSSAKADEGFERMTVSSGRSEGIGIKLNKEKGYYHGVEIKKADDFTTKYTGHLKNIRSLNIPKKDDQMQVKDLVKSLEEALLPLEGFITQESDFQAILQGLFTAQKVGEDEFIRVFIEPNHANGRADIVVANIKKKDNGKYKEELSTLIELKYAESEKDAKMKHEEGKTQIKKYKVNTKTYIDGKGIKGVVLTFCANAGSGEKLITLYDTPISVSHTSQSEMGREQSSIDELDTDVIEEGSPPRKKTKPSPEEQELSEFKIRAGCSSSREKRSTGMPCIDSKDEESIEEKEGEKKLIEELFSTDKGVNIMKYFEFYEQFYKDFWQVKKQGKIANSGMQDLIDRAKGLDLLDREVKDVIEQFKANIGDQERIREIMSTSKVLDKVGEMAGWGMRGWMIGNILGNALDGNIEDVGIGVGVLVGDTLIAKATGATPISWYLMARSLANDIERLAAGDLSTDTIVKTSLDVTILALSFLAITNPELAPVVDILIIGEQIYLAVRTVERENEIIRLTDLEKFTEGFRAFFGVQPKRYIQELMEKGQVDNQLVKSAIEFLKDHLGIKRYIFPAGKLVSVLDDHRSNKKLKWDDDSSVYLNEERTDIKLSRIRLNTLGEGEIFCQPGCESSCDSNEYRRADGPAYFCKNAIGVSHSLDKTVGNTLINLGDGIDIAVGFEDSPNVFLVGNGSKNFTGGEKDDVFILNGEEFEGILDGKGGVNVLDLTNFAPSRDEIDVYLETGKVRYFQGDTYCEGGVQNMHRILGREDRRDFISVSCDTKFVDGQGGWDRIVIGYNKGYYYDLRILMRSNATVYNNAVNGEFNYHVPFMPGTAYISIYDETGRSRHTVVLDDIPMNVAIIDITDGGGIVDREILFRFELGGGSEVQYVIQYSSFVASSLSFQFVSKGSHMIDNRASRGIFNYIIGEGAGLSTIVIVSSNDTQHAVTFADLPNDMKRIHITMDVSDSGIEFNFASVSGINIEKYIFGSLSLLSFQLTAKPNTTIINNARNGSFHYAIMHDQNQKGEINFKLGKEGEFVNHIFSFDYTFSDIKSIKLNTTNDTRHTTFNFGPLIADPVIEYCVHMMKSIVVTNKGIAVNFWDEANRLVLSRFKDEGSTIEDRALCDALKNILNIDLPENESDFSKELNMTEIASLLRHEHPKVDDGNFNITITDKYNKYRIFCIYYEHMGPFFRVNCDEHVDIKVDIHSMVNTKNNAIYKLQDGTEVRFLKDAVYVLHNTKKHVNMIIDHYLGVACRLNAVLIVNSIPDKETVTIGCKKGEIIFNDHVQTSHLFGNGGEDVYLITSGKEKLKVGDLPVPNVNIYCDDNSIDNLNLLEIKKQVRKDLNVEPSLNITSEGEDILINISTPEISVLTVIFKDGVSKYESLRVYYLDAKTPMQLKNEDDNWKLDPILKGAKVVFTGAYRYYRPSSGESLQVYHNQPENKHQIGMMNFENQSILNCNMSLNQDTGSLVLSLKDGTSLTMENYATVGAARKMMFFFSDTKVYDIRCVISTCDPEDVIAEFNKKREQLILDKELRDIIREGRSFYKVENLIKQGANVQDAEVDFVGKYKDTILHRAAYRCSSFLVVHFIERGVNIHDRDMNGRTALHVAARNGCLDTAQRLVEKGANVFAKDHSGRKPSGIASAMKKSDVEKYLKEIEQRKPVLRKRRHHHGDHNRYHLSRKPLAIDSSNQLEMAASSGTRPSSLINIIANTIVDAIKDISRFVYSPKVELPEIQKNGSDHSDTVRNPSDHYTSQFSSEVCISNNIGLGFFLLQSFLDKEYPLPKFCSITPEEALANTLNIIGEFEKTLEKTAKQSGISVKGFDFFKVYLDIAGHVRNERYCQIPNTLYSVAKEVCPKNEKFLSNLKGNIEKMCDEQQVVNSGYQPNGIADNKPRSYLNNTTVDKQLQESYHAISS